MHPIIDKVLVPLDRSLAVDWIWRPIEASLIRFVRGLRRRRTDVQIQQLFKRLQNYPEVLQGKFAGMRYASIEAACSAILPKLLGTYESELDEVFESVFKRSYDIIADVGCAEGYYAVGLARRFSSSQIYAFDIDPRAQRLCGDNASLNGVSGRVEVGGGVNAEQLAATVRGRRALVICDCEGFEGSLFTESTVAAYNVSDLLIETHDFIESGLCQRISSLFSKTHRVQVVHSIDDLQKARTYKSPAVDALDFEAKELAFAEGRPVIMEWLYLIPQQNI